MARIRSANTKPEMVVRRLVHSLGYRYRLHVRSLPGKPDLVFRKRKKVIFVHGCFWHQHQAPDCPIVRVPKSSADYWRPKLLRNVTRDEEHIAALESMGWNVLVVWECMVADTENLRITLQRFLSKDEQQF